MHKHSIQISKLKRAKIYLIWSLLCRSRLRRASAHVVISHHSTYYAFGRDIY
jgi:hypothetical protein